MADLRELVSYISAEMVKDGDTLTFVDGGKLVEKNFKKDGKDDPRMVLEITVELPDGKRKSYTPNGTSFKKLSSKYGMDSELWIGKQAKVTLLSQNVAGNIKKVVYTEPV